SRRPRAGVGSPREISLGRKSRPSPGLLGSTGSRQDLWQMPVVIFRLLDEALRAQKPRPAATAALKKLAEEISPDAATEKRLVRYSRAMDFWRTGQVSS